MSQIWAKGDDLDATIHRFTVGNDHELDERLVRFDITASKSHARTLHRGGYLTQSELDQLVTALDEVGASHERGEWHIQSEEEDCHTAIEARLIARLGELGGKVHLGRSRNDQILVCLRLYILAACTELSTRSAEVAHALTKKAEQVTEVPIPGYTHMQRAMPSTASDLLLGFATNLTESSHAIDSAKKLADRSPLGSAAGYGTPGLALDREFTATDLGFGAVQNPVTACQTSRGKAEAALAFACSLLLTDLGRLAAELCLLSTAEYGFVKLPAKMTTGSSIMPQKRNPDVFELVRGYSAEGTAALVAILGIIQKLPSGYHRDLQLLKPHLFGIVDRTMLVLEVMREAVPGIEFREEACKAAMTSELYAAQKAFEIVKSQGISFREAYHIVAKEYTLVKGERDFETKSQTPE